MNAVLDWDLVHGTVPIVVTMTGLAAGAVLLFRRDRRWWARTVPITAAACAAVTLLLWLVVDVLWKPFPDPVPRRVIAWIGVALFGAGLAIVWSRRSRWSRRGVSVLAGIVVVLAAGANINAHYGHFPSLRAALELPPANEVPFSSLGPATGPAVPRSPGRALLDDWQPPPTMPENGVVTQVSIPAAASHFPVTRNAYLYLPPAYRTSPRPLLPVLVLLHGQPGAPRDWIDGGGIAAMMDRFAAAHRGLAPVVVMPDSTGSAFGNPLCLDSRLGRSETYLTGDVPGWISRNLQVDPDTRRWAVGGYSYGGTCALQLALRQPQVFPTFVDISGQDEPTLGSRAKTVDEAFDGDERAFRQFNPMDLLATRGFPGSAGVISVGESDSEFRPQQQRVFEAARRNGIDVTWRQTPGSHNWQAWSAGLNASLDWLTGRMGLVQR
ncbi:alpha/beta hydrolase family protein [Amycolatopsis sp. YIM 10]|uniref:alpha/beta hydrolase n=1 Tax=Amycolatopsis sp. YIM 10 TaxID=2653857 RepID=UPI0012908359|nr:alpha/beta hydrolase-fold protein [Amycolatopsis sp. YIM 10]QFU92478.1 Endo-1,4-beta-xylanase Z precursor [Amycolatopsis sp. YIM 10]